MSPPPVGSPLSLWRSRCQSGARGRSSASTPMARHGGGNPAKFVVLVFSAMTVCFWAVGAIITYATMVRSMFCVVRQPDPARASGGDVWRQAILPGFRFDEGAIGFPASGSLAPKA